MHLPVLVWCARFRERRRVHYGVRHGLFGLGIFTSIFVPMSGAKSETILDADQTVNSGEEIIDDIIRIGDQADATVTVTGTDAVLTASDSLYLGGAAAITGELIIQNGAAASATIAHIGVDGEGKVTVTGTDSRFEVTDVAYIASEAAGSGSLTVTDAGHATIDTVHVGNRGEGTAMITGQDSRLEVTDTLYIATYEGAVGTMTVEAGGSVEAKRAVIAESGEGHATVSGEGSSWTITEDLILATRTGDGTLEIKDGGFVSAAAVTFGEDGAGKGRILLGGGSGGVLATGQVERVDGDAEFLIDNGTLRLTRDQDRLFDGMAEVVIGPGAAVFDTQGFAVTAVASLTGTGALGKIGTGTLTLGERATYEGETRIEAGTLAAAGTDMLSAASAHRIETDGALLLNGFDQTIAALENGGALYFGGTAPGTLLTVTGAYVGNGGTIYFKTQLGDDSSPTDRMLVQGDAAGDYAPTTIRVTNVGGLGAQTAAGIKLIDVEGLSFSTFTLAGDYAHNGQQAVVAGAYAYMLYKGSAPLQNEDDWFLRSEWIDGDTSYQLGVAAYESYTQILLGLNGLPTLEQRVGNRFWTPASGAVWGRIEGAHDSMKPDVSTAGADYKADRFKMQAGLDALLADSEGGRLIGGLNILYMRGDADVFSVHGNGDIGIDGYGLGGTLTWYGAEGFYADSQAQLAWYRSDLTGEPSDSKSIALTRGNDALGYALSLESGKRIALGGNWSATPQAQLSYSNVKFDGFTDAFDADVSAGDHDSLKGRLGMALNRDSAWTDEAGTAIRAKAYGIANLYYEFLDGTSVDVAGTSFDSRNDRLWGGFGAGGSYGWADDAYVIYGEALADTSLENFAESYSIQATLGLRLNW